MGTRADFYVGRGKTAEWIGSIAWDGHTDGIPNSIKRATDEMKYRKSVMNFLKSRDDGTLPEQGYPFPWTTSATTDYTYAFDEAKVHASCFGHAWFDPNGEEPELDEADGKEEFPDLSSVQRVNMGSRSGLIVFTKK